MLTMGVTELIENWLLISVAFLLRVSLSIMLKMEVTELVVNWLLKSVKLLLSVECHAKHGSYRFDSDQAKIS